LTDSGQRPIDVKASVRAPFSFEVAELSRITTLWAVMLEEPKIEIRYSPIFIGVLIVSAIVLFGVYLHNSHPAGAVIACINGFAGFQMSRLPAYILRPTQLECLNLLGVLPRRIEFASLSEFEVDAKRRLWHVGWTGEPSTVNFPTFGLHRSDLERFYRAIEARAFV